MTAIYARATYDYDAQDDEDLSFREGDIIEVLSRDGDWWKGKSEDGRMGLFPFNRVELMPGYQKQTAISSNLSSLGGNSPNETVRSVKVDLVRGTRKGEYNYDVKVTLLMGSVNGQKTMNDFRKFHDTLLMLDPGFNFVVELSPEWADELPLTNTNARLRAQLLSKFCQGNTKGKELFDTLLLQWVKTNKDQQKTRPSSPNVKLTPSDSKPIVLKKIIEGMAYCYKQENDPINKFVGSQKEGELVQVIYDWNGRDETELSLSVGEFILVLSRDKQDGGWWFGQKADGEKGTFPSNYIVAMDQNAIQRKLKRTGSPAKSQVSPPVVKTPTFASSAAKLHKPAPNFNAGGSSNNLMSSNKSNATPQQDTGPGRERKIEKGYCVKSCDAYEELRSKGFTIEQSGRAVKLRKNGPENPSSGSLVTLNFSAYVWDPQTQQLREFSSSDKLKAPPKGVTSGQAGASGFKMEFVVGQNMVNEGLEEIVQMLKVNDPVRAIISPMKGYGDVGSPPEIPGNCYLVYDLTLEKIAKSGMYAPPRNQIFSVGISRATVQAREPAMSGAQYRAAHQPGRTPNKSPFEY